MINTQRHLVTEVETKPVFSVIGETLISVRLEDPSKGECEAAAYRYLGEASDRLAVEQSLLRAFLS